MLTMEDITWHLCSKSNCFILFFFFSFNGKIWIQIPFLLTQFAIFNNTFLAKQHLLFFQFKLIDLIVGIAYITIVYYIFHYLVLTCELSMIFISLGFKIDVTSPLVRHVVNFITKTFLRKLSSTKKIANFFE